MFFLRGIFSDIDRMKVRNAKVYEDVSSSSFSWYCMRVHTCNGFPYKIKNNYLNFAFQQISHRF